MKKPEADDEQPTAFDAYLERRLQDPEFAAQYQKAQQEMGFSVKVTLPINVWKVVSEAVEAGVRIGYRRAHKHVDNPSEEHVVDNVCREVMNSLTEVVDFERAAYEQED